MCKRLHDCDMLQKPEVRKLIRRHGPGAYAVFVTLLDLLFKQPRAQMELDAEVISDLTGFEVELIKITIATAIELQLLVLDGNINVFFHVDTLADKAKDTERKERFRQRATNASRSRATNASRSRATKTSTRSNNNLSTRHLQDKSTHVVKTSLRSCKKDLGEQEQEQEQEKEQEEVRKVKPDKCEFAPGVFLTESEFQQLAEKYGGAAYVQTRLESMSDYQNAHGKRYRDHAAAFRQWERRGREASQRPPSVVQGGLEFGNKRSKQFLGIRDSLRAIDDHKPKKPAIEVEVIR